MDEYEDSWDRTDISPCDPCYIGVSDLGLYQCRDCLALFIGRSGRKAVITSLKSDYGELWSEEYEKLKTTRSLVRQHKYEQLRGIHCTYRKESGKIKTDRIFYEKAT